MIQFIYQSNISIILFSFLERSAFKLSRIIAIPAWLFYILARPAANQLDYDSLIEMAPAYPTIPKLSLKQVQKQQRKWSDRILRIALLNNCKKILEVGCGRGYSAFYLYREGLQVIACDLENTLNEDIQKSGLPFLISDVSYTLPYKDNSFDLVYSINAFEHFNLAEAALDEMLRVTKPGGLIFMTFGPLYNSPFGLHASRRLGIPYPQFLFPLEMINRFFDENRADLLTTFDAGSDTTKIAPYVNQYSLNQYRQIFASKRNTFRPLIYVERTTFSGLSMICKHAGLMKTQVSAFEELIIDGIKVLGKKHSSTTQPR